MRSFYTLCILLCCSLLLSTTGLHAKAVHEPFKSCLHSTVPDTTLPHLLTANEDSHGDSDSTRHEDGEGDKKDHEKDHEGEGEDPKGSHTAPHCVKGHLWVKMISPVDQSSFPAGKPVKLTADAGVQLGKSATLSIYYLDGAQAFLMGSSTVAPYTAGVDQPGEGVYKAFAKISNGQDSAYSDTITVTITGCHGSGYVIGEKWDGIPGLQVADLEQAPSYPANPSMTAMLSSWSYGPGIGDNYGARVRGYICAPYSGFYTFYVSGDDQVGLWLSTDDDPANKKLIAYVQSWVPFARMDLQQGQQSAPIFLAKGGRYYIETLHKQSVGPNHLIVAWKMPGDVLENPIPGSRLSPVENTLGNRRVGAFPQAPQDTSLVKVQTTHRALVFPNPTQNAFRVVLSPGTGENATVRVMDLTGKVLESYSWHTAPEQAVVGSRLKPGIYMIETVQGSQRTVTRALKN